MCPLSAKKRQRTQKAQTFFVQMDCLSQKWLRWNHRLPSTNLLGKPRWGSYPNFCGSKPPAVLPFLSQSQAETTNRQDLRKAAETISKARDETTPVSAKRVGCWIQKVQGDSLNSLAKLVYLPKWTMVSDDYIMLHLRYLTKKCFFWLVNVLFVFF